ncbi:MAG: hypothetical protein MMC33_009385 [Icmadophila ericetorum]|nr:hypothetical protein [Icmadophila ericetorum]
MTDPAIKLSPDGKNVQYKDITISIARWHSAVPYLIDEATQLLRGRLRPADVLRYLDSVTHFLDLLLVLFLFTSEHPPYGRDLLQVRFTAAGPDHRRNIGIYEGVVTVSTATELPPREIITRQLPNKVGGLVVRYFLDVRPFLLKHQELAHSYGLDNHPLFTSQYLFPPGQGLWNEERYDAAIRTWTRALLGVTLSLEAYRDIYLGIAAIERDRQT